MNSDSEINVEAAESRWFVWGRSAFAVAVAAVLIALGVANVTTYSRWHEYEDGVQWGARAEGVTAIEVVPTARRARSPASSSATCCWRSTTRRFRRRPTSSNISTAATRGPSSTTRWCGSARSEALQISLTPTPRGSSIYFVLAAVGLFALARRRAGPGPAAARSGDAAFLLALRRVLRRVYPFRSADSSIASTGSSTGVTRSPSRCCRRCCCTSRWFFRSARPTDRRTDELANASSPRRPADVPAGARARRRPRHRDRARFGRQPARVRSSRASSTRSNRAEPAYLFVCAVAALAVLARAFRDITSVTARRQLRWIAGGTALGVGPFAFGYGCPGRSASIRRSRCS